MKQIEEVKELRQKPTEYIDLEEEYKSLTAFKAMNIVPFEPNLTLAVDSEESVLGSIKAVENADEVTGILIATKNDRLAKLEEFLNGLSPLIELARISNEDSSRELKKQYYTLRKLREIEKNFQLNSMETFEKWRKGRDVQLRALEKRTSNLLSSLFSNDFKVNDAVVLLENCLTALANEKDELNDWNPPIRPLIDALHVQIVKVEHNVGVTQQFIDVTTRLTRMNNGWKSVSQEQTTLTALITATGRRGRAT
jgi:hypothetical protein